MPAVSVYEAEIVAAPLTPITAIGEPNRVNNINTEKTQNKYISSEIKPIYSTCYLVGKEKSCTMPSE